MNVLKKKKKTLPTLLNSASKTGGSTKSENFDQPNFVAENCLLITTLQVLSHK